MCRGWLDPQDFWRGMKKQFNYTGKDISFIDFWIENFKKIQLGHDLAKLLSKDFQLGLITNAYPGVIESVLSTSLMPQIKWSSIIQSCDYGLVKPEKELFEIAQKKVGYGQDQLVLIDDAKLNCDMAEAIGWKGILFNSGLSL